MNIPNETVPAVVMTIGRGSTEMGDGTYEATMETGLRAVAAAEYYLAHPHQNTDYLISGGYGRLATRGRTQAPPHGYSEAQLAKKIFYDHIDDEIKAEQNQRALGQAAPEGDWKTYPCGGPNILTEDYSGDTFANFTASIHLGYLRPGEFNRRAPLFLSISRVHSWRAAAVADQALALPPNALWRLPDSGHETGPIMEVKERLLLAVTRYALANVGETSGAEPGNPAHTEAAGELFEELSNQPTAAILKAVQHPMFWRRRGVDLPVAHHRKS